MGKNVLNTMRLFLELVKGIKLKLGILLIIIIVFKVEVALMIPIVMKYSFQAMSEGDGTKLWKIAFIGTIVLFFNFIIMYFINVYGDAWITQFSFHAAENVYKELSKGPVCTSVRNYQEKEVFQRIAAGTGSMVGLCFIVADLLSSFFSVISLIYILWSVSLRIGIFSSCMVLIGVVCVIFQYSFNNKYSGLVQKSKSVCLEKVHTIVYDYKFHEQNQTKEWMHEIYQNSREEFFNVQKCQLRGNLIFESFMSISMGSFKTGLIWDFNCLKEKVNSYTEDIAATLTTFDSLGTKTQELGKSIASYPKLFVPINRLNQLLDKKSTFLNTYNRDIYSLEHISVSIQEKKILKDLSFSMTKGEKIALIGENGSGKSTFLRVLAGLYRTDAGEVISTKEKVQYIPADDVLFKGHSVMQNIRYGNNKISNDTIIEYLNSFRILNVNEFMKKCAEEISGGEAKRVNVMRGILGDGEIVLADEPTSSLDESIADRVMNVLLNYAGTVVFVTHSPKFARMADKIVMMKDGKIIQVLKKEECNKNYAFSLWEHKIYEVEEH